MAKQVLTVIFGYRDLAAQRAHLARGALFLPEPEPLPEPFVEIVLRVETPSGAGIELDGRVLQILAGHGIAVAFDHPSVAKARLEPLFAEEARGDEAPTFVFWGRGESIAKKTTFPPGPIPQPPLDHLAAIAPAPPSSVTIAIAPEAPASPIDPALELEPEPPALLVDQIAKMTANEKMQLALKGDREARQLLVKDVNKSIQAFVVQNPRITIDEVRYLAAFRQASPDVLVTISSNREWMNNPGVVGALVRNPKTPGATAIKLLDKLPIAEVRRLAKSDDVPRAVVTAARKKIEP